MEVIAARGKPESRSSLHGSLPTFLNCPDANCSPATSYSKGYCRERDTLGSSSEINLLKDRDGNGTENAAELGNLNLLKSVPMVCSVQFYCRGWKSRRGVSGTAHAEVVIAVLFSLAVKLPLVRQSASPL
jgi:hypothetical protein